MPDEGVKCSRLLNAFDKGFQEKKFKPLNGMTTKANKKSRYNKRLFIFKDI